jgi:ferredoxin/flavodoxin---NADP+ reductase
MAKLLEYNATLTGRIDFEDTLASFTVTPDTIERRGASTGPWFIPGQYLTIGLNRAVVDGNDDPRPLSVRRPMSIASAPQDEHEVEFYIRRVSTPESDLPLTHLMWPIQVGDRMYCRAVATGKFTLRDTVGEDDPRLKVTVAAGTGLAPFLSMARARLRDDPDARLDDLAILHGASYPSSLGYADELRHMAERNGLKYLPTISRPAEFPDWQGYSGRVEALLAPENLDKTEEGLGLPPGGLRPDKAVVLICGLQGTIANTIISLLDRGFIPDNKRLRRGLQVDDALPATVYWEQYDTTPVLDIKDEPLMERLRAALATGMR